MATNPQGAITAYLIDPARRTIAAVDLPGGPQHLQDIYTKLQCNLITSVPLGPQDTVYCDDEGLLHGPVYQFFGVRGVAQPIAGCGLVVGLDDDGNDTTPALSLEEVRERVYFIERLTRDLWSLRAATRLQTCDIAPLDHVVRQVFGEVCHG